MEEVQKTSKKAVNDCFHVCGKESLDKRRKRNVEDFVIINEKVDPNVPVWKPFVLFVLKRETPQKRRQGKLWITCRKKGNDCI